MTNVEIGYRIYMARKENHATLEEVAKKVIEGLGEEKGIDVSQMTGVDFAQFKETQYDKLAQGLREHLDMKKIYEILEQGI